MTAHIKKRPSTSSHCNYVHTCIASSNEKHKTSSNHQKVVKMISKPPVFRLEPPPNPINFLSTNEFDYLMLSTSSQQNTANPYESEKFLLYFLNLNNSTESNDPSYERIQRLSHDDITNKCYNFKMHKNGYNQDSISINTKLHHHQSKNKIQDINNLKKLVYNTNNNHAHNKSSISNQTVAKENLIYDYISGSVNSIENSSANRKQVYFLESSSNINNLSNSNKSFHYSSPATNKRLYKLTQHSTSASSSYTPSHSTQFHNDKFNLTLSNPINTSSNSTTAYNFLLYSSIFILFCLLFMVFYLIFTRNIKSNSCKSHKRSRSKRSKRRDATDANKGNHLPRHLNDSLLAESTYLSASLNRSQRHNANNTPANDILNNLIIDDSQLKNFLLGNNTFSFDSSSKRNNIQQFVKYDMLNETNSNKNFNRIALIPSNQIVVNNDDSVAAGNYFTLTSFRKNSFESKKPSYLNHQQDYFELNKLLNVPDTATYKTATLLMNQENSSYTIKNNLNATQMNNVGKLKEKARHGFVERCLCHTATTNTTPTTTIAASSSSSSQTSSSLSSADEHSCGNNINNLLLPNENCLPTQNYQKLFFNTTNAHLNNNGEAIIFYNNANLTNANNSAGEVLNALNTNTLNKAAIIYNTDHLSSNSSPKLIQIVNLNTNTSINPNDNLSTMQKQNFTIPAFYECFQLVNLVDQTNLGNSNTQMPNFALNSNLASGEQIQSNKPSEPGYENESLLLNVSSNAKTNEVQTTNQIKEGQEQSNKKHEVVQDEYELIDEETSVSVHTANSNNKPFPTFHTVKATTQANQLQPPPQPPPLPPNRSPPSKVKPGAASVTCSSSFKKRYPKTNPNYNNSTLKNLKN